MCNWAKCNCESCKDARHKEANRLAIIKMREDLVKYLARKLEERKQAELSGK